MLTRIDIQEAITEAARSGMGAVDHHAFRLTPAGWIPRKKCLDSAYSSGERVVCGILLHFYFEIMGRPDHVEIPKDRQWEHTPADLVWPGAYYFERAVSLLTNHHGWAAIQRLLPKEPL